ncbi:interleukin-16 [Aphelenchoides avenae]|nr:interleukin-16 [Aphelenchus avenae]
MRPHAEHLLLSAYALEMERCWEDSRHDKLDEIYENAWALRGTTSSAFARGVVYEFRARRLLLIPRISRARKLLKDAAEAYELCKSHRRHLCTHLDNMCGSVIRHVNEIWRDVLVLAHLSHKEYHNLQLTCRLFQGILQLWIEQDHAAKQYQPPMGVIRVIISRQVGMDDAPDKWNGVIVSVNGRQICASGDHRTVFKFVEQVCYRERPSLVITWKANEPLDLDNFLVKLNEYCSDEVDRRQRNRQISLLGRPWCGLVAWRLSRGVDREYLPGTMGEDTLLERKEHEEDIIDKLVQRAIIGSIADRDVRLCNKVFAVINLLAGEAARNGQESIGDEIGSIDGIQLSGMTHLEAWKTLKSMREGPLEFVVYKRILG